MNELNKNKKTESLQDFRRMIAPYSQPLLRSALWQIINSFLPYFALWALMIFSIKNGWPYWATFLLALPAGVLLVRIFILFHDCCHGSFFSSNRANQILGYVAGIATFTSYRNWRHSHLMHHATFGDLDKRGLGDIWTMTVEEYQSASRWRRFAYRFYRNPLVLLLLGPIYTFYIDQRFSPKESDKRQRRSVWITNIALLAVFLSAGFTIGFKTYLTIQILIMLVAGAIGVWLFYVQHQYDGVYWARSDNWDPLKAALEGSSYYRLPAVLQWATGNIGLHHIHHLHPRIPNYLLQKCCDEVPALQSVKPLTIRASLKSLRLNLWDEKQQKLVGFRQLKKLAPVQ